MSIDTIVWPEIAQAVATAAGSAGVIAALIYAARQTRALSEQARLQREEAERNVELQRANLELRLMELTIALDRIFLDRPHLRPYFYENRPLRWWSSSKRRAEVTSVAEVVIDFVDSIGGLRRHGQLSDRNYANWRVFTESYYQQSPAARALWQHWGEFYLPETAEFFSEIDGPTDLHSDLGAGRSSAMRERLARIFRPSVPPFVRSERG